MEPEARFEILGAVRAFRGADPVDIPALDGLKAAMSTTV